MSDISLERLAVCGGSGALLGPLFADGAPFAWQRCLSRECLYFDAAWHQPDPALREPYGDFPTEVELCHCCASVAIPSGSRFSSFFCAGCNSRAVALNRALGFAAIPIGRHSLMHGITLSARDDARFEDAARAFMQSCTSLWERIDRLDAWRRVVVADRIDAMGAAATGSVALTAYLAFSAAHAPSPEAMFAQLGRYLGLDPDALEAIRGGQDEPEH